MISGWLRALAAFALLLTAGATIHPTQGKNPVVMSSEVQAFQPDSRGVTAAKLMLLDDFRGYLEGKKVVGDWQKTTPIAERVTAQELFSFYSKNEVAADDRFKGKSILLTGTIEKISKDIVGSVYLVIDAGGFLESVQASLADETASQAGSFSQGSDIALVCTGNGMILTSPMLKDCQTTDVVFDLKRAEVENTVNDFLTGSETDLPDNMKMVIGYSYAAGVSMPRGNPCETADISNMKACLSALNETANDPDGKATIRDSYAALAGHIKLPPLPTRLQSNKREAR